MATTWINLHEQVGALRIEALGYQQQPDHRCRFHRHRGPGLQFSGVGNFSSVPRETDLLLRNSKTGGLEVYNINNNQLTGAAFIGAVGLDWQSSGVGNFRGVPDETDLLL